MKHYLYSYLDPGTGQIKTSDGFFEDLEDLRQQIRPQGRLFLVWEVGNLVAMNCRPYTTDECREIGG